jgi:hypothetical protein
MVLGKKWSIWHVFESVFWMCFLKIRTNPLESQKSLFGNHDFCEFAIFALFTTLFKLSSSGASLF